MNDSPRQGPPSGLDANGAARPEPTLRLFVALWPDADARRALHAWARGCRWPRGAAVVAPERWHLTLHFIGAWSQAKLPALSAALRWPEVAPGRAFAPFELRFDRAEIWPRGLVVLGCSELPATLLDLHARVGQALQRQGVVLERRELRPHLTLARRASEAQLPLEAPSFRWSVRGYALVQSANGYRTLQTEP